MKTCLILTLLFAGIFGNFFPYSEINHIAATGVASNNDHNNTECVLTVQLGLSTSQTGATAYQFYLIAQKDYTTAAAGETGIFCSLAIDTSNRYTGSCYTLTVTVSANT